MDLNALALFAKVVEAGGFTRAAEALGLQKSKVSRKVAALEAELGVRLLERTTQKVRATEAGRVFYERCRALAAEAEEAAEHVRALGAEPRGLLAISAPIELGTHFSSRVLPGFLAKHPAVSVRMGLSYRFVDLFDEGFDVALRVGRAPHPGLVVVELGQLRRRLFASPGYLARRGAPGAPAELSRHDCLLFRAGRGVDAWALSDGKKAVEVEVSGPFACDHFQALRNAAVAGLGVVALPEQLFAEDISGGRLAGVLPGWRLPAGVVSAVYPSRALRPAKLGALLDYLRREPGWLA